MQDPLISKTAAFYEIKDPPSVYYAPAISSRLKSVNLKRGDVVKGIAKDGDADWLKIDEGWIQSEAVRPYDIHIAYDTFMKAKAAKYVYTLIMRSCSAKLVSHFIDPEFRAVRVRYESKRPCLRQSCFLFVSVSMFVAYAMSLQNTCAVEILGDHGMSGKYITTGNISVMDVNGTHACYKSPSVPRCSTLPNGTEVVLQGLVWFNWSSPSEEKWARITRPVDSFARVESGNHWLVEKRSTSVDSRYLGGLGGVRSRFGSLLELHPIGCKIEDEANRILKYIANLFLVCLPVLPRFIQDTDMAVVSGKWNRAWQYITKLIRSQTESLHASCLQGEPMLNGRAMYAGLVVWGGGLWSAILLSGIFSALLAGRFDYVQSLLKHATVFIAVLTVVGHLMLQIGGFLLGARDEFREAILAKLNSVKAGEYPPILARMYHSNGRSSQWCTEAELDALWALPKLREAVMSGRMPFSCGASTFELDQPEKACCTPPQETWKADVPSFLKTIQIANGNMIIDFRAGELYRNGNRIYNEAWERDAREINEAVNQSGASPV
jgi:hypothetical protein